MVIAALIALGATGVTLVIVGDLGEHKVLRLVGAVFAIASFVALIVRGPRR